MSMSEYEYTQRLQGLDTKSIRSRRTVTVGDGWVTKFVSNPANLDGMHIREITISERMSTSGDIEKLTNMINAARQGRIAMKNKMMRG
ncbi:hypothetical protein [Leuconostoc citreum]